MFGLLYTLLVSTGLIANEIKEIKENAECKKKFVHPDGLTYIDSYGRSRLLSDNRLVIYTCDKNGDYILKETGGKLIKNFSAEERKTRERKVIEEARRCRNTTYCIDENNHKQEFGYHGKRFKDFKTGEVYVVRCIRNKYYYMNIATGFLVRKTDWQVKRDLDNQNNSMYQKNFRDIDIEEFNKKQKEQGSTRNYDYCGSCDFCH